MVAVFATYLLNGMPPRGPAAATILYLFLVAWLLLLGFVMVRSLRQLRVRLLLGARGLARWSADESLVVLWDDLGTVWRRVSHLMNEGDPLAVVLEHQDGTRLAITAFFADFHQASLRVLEELASRTGSKDGETCQPGVTSDAITTAERGVVEPGETP
jgi:hypothetical protein